MPQPQENLWHFNAVTPGQQGPQTQVTLTPQNIAAYAHAAQCPHPRYHQPDNPQALAMPTMILSYAPLLRETIAHANGYTPLEHSQTARRQTPFAKCEIRWHQPVTAGDTITATRQVLEKYERRQNRFVTFQIQTTNQRHQLTAEYDYTCIFDYTPTPRQTRPNPPPTETGQPGTPLTPLTITETRETINRRNDYRLAGPPNPSNIHTDEHFAQQNIFGAIVNSGPATMSYIDQMLQQTYPPEALYHGGSLLMRAITPFRAQDTVTFTGQTTAQNPLKCQIRGTNQRQELVCLAEATLNP